jgi:hypothetical protein
LFALRDEEKLVGYQDRIRTASERDGVTVVDAGLVDNLDKSAAAADLFANESVDLMFLSISRYALSFTVLPVVRKTKGQRQDLPHTAPLVSAEILDIDFQRVC